MLPDTKQTVEDLLKILERKTDKKIEPVKPQMTVPARKFTDLLLDEPKHRSPVVFQKKVHEFVTIKQFQSGDHYIEAFILFFYFNEWNTSRGRKVKRHIISFRNFCNILKTFFPIKTGKNNTLLLGIDKDIREDYLTPQKEAAIRRWTKNENKRKTKKKNKKI